MCNESKTIWRIIHCAWISALVLVLSYNISTATATITSASWSGNDFILSLSDSASYSVDIEESDTNRCIVQISNVSLASSLQGSSAFPGSDSRTASVTNSGTGAQLTVLGSASFGYSILWRPYSHQLVIHTFSWSQLSYAEEQYHKGLLALEQGVDDEAEKLLAVGYGTGENRAGSVLGWYYTKLGKDSLALRYLSAPLVADDYAALAQIKRHMGDASAAAEYEKKFKDALAQTTPVETQTTVNTPGNNTEQATGDRDKQGLWDRFRNSLSDWRTAAAVCLFGLAILLGIGWLIMRRSANKKAQQQATIVQTPQPTPEPAFRRLAPEEQRESPVVTTEAPVEETPVESPKPVPPPPPVIKEPVIAPVETVPVQVPEPPVVAPPVVVEPEVIVSPPPPVETAQPTVVVEATEAKSETIATEPERPLTQRQAAAQRIPAQAAELRRKLEAMRLASESAKSDPGTDDAATTTSESPEETVDTARRMNVSRDHIELRKKLSEMLRDKETDG